MLISGDAIEPSLSIVTEPRDALALGKRRTTYDPFNASADALHVERDNDVIVIDSARNSMADGLGYDVVMVEVRRQPQHADRRGRDLVRGGAASTSFIAAFGSGLQLLYFSKVSKTRNSFN